MPNKIKTNPETPILFQPSGNPFPSGVGFASGIIVQFGIDNLSSLQGRVSNEYDLGPGPRTSLYEWRGVAQIPVGTAIGTSVDAYISTNNSVYKDGNLPITDNNINFGERRRNLQFCGSMVCDNTPPNSAISAGVVEIFGRYVSVMWWNNTPAPLGTGNCFILTPIPDEVENS